ncbi:MAG: hypothetical protein A2487_00290 [Candidatus Raymondbacteria bacterium RifOxyC12_full_50_8]|uniref:Crp/Fnr family transcriptional regulator n=1 Tax=Candidatus Raymondbacteria bacterium RIFOXYD12_FULL_49_13 TaxID=1817890 RepID=A0A1F7FLZ6_UNCRA|nr:MAG: hypothetical protein A2248_08800 [Candidatus Raymondbacteria bacterium RIFOXYA2_FULL_49_16]OGK07492.1 MAG: hypothetical protein A2519_20245 [Candidatus Raymondbacteria bacterium RIFOXYD12_FULL_49_13]OGK07777.1 MAG: hypothetical protein A2487_00290 [Candidatus Raymondbacteria bacterium RifOxyC12_full_50_8]OGP43848.1 MAG: hypothetical protein A2324_01475 [Candidatus Raymondbacteria bacterium RIFOXYB2_FULL_49_35]
MDDIAGLLARAEFFKGASERSKKALSQICIPKKLKKRQTLFMEGDKGVCFYLCGAGNIQVFKMDPNGKEIVLKVIQPGEIFAEVILFENDVYPASAVAISDSLVYIISKHEFSCLLETAQFRDDFIRALMRKQRYLVEQIHTLSAYNVEDRFLRFIIEQYGVKPEYAISMSKKDIAAAIGATPEAFSRALLSLSKAGVIAWKGKALRIRASRA